MKDELLIKFLLKEANEQEKAEVQQWIAADADHKTYFAQFEKIWLASKTLSPNGKADEEQAWIRFKARVAANQSAKDSHSPVAHNSAIKSLNVNYTWLKVAASLVLIAGIWFAYNFFGDQKYTDLLAGNQVIKEILPDGSEITMNKNSVISYATDFKEERSIHLKQGDVFFDVAHDKSHPFVIEIDQVSVTVVGTSFNIRHIKDETEVVVETGIVKVASGNDVIELRQGEKVSIKPSSPQLIKETNKDQLYNYYRSNYFLANNIPLIKLTMALNEAYDTQIVINEPSTANEPINTTLKRSDSFDSNLAKICRTMDLKITRNGAQILLSKNK
ncbi:FecR family protein [Pedobacter frigoris]|uniref:FecR family protein n=1 Tax=Pedobacter frigoris TaxID=2571272 RepID=UPI00292F6281|nr:FecR domain-containing protein [Pedobacter frigoris]